MARLVQSRGSDIGSCVRFLECCARLIAGGSTPLLFVSSDSDLPRDISLHGSTAAFSYGARIHVTAAGEGYRGSAVQSSSPR